MTEQTKSTLKERLNNWMPQRELAGIIGGSSDTLKRWGDAVNRAALHPHRPIVDSRRAKTPLGSVPRSGRSSKAQYSTACSVHRARQPDGR